MPIKAYRPMTNGQRGMTTQDFDGITTKKPLRSLITIKKGSVGRNNQGRITTRHRGGGVRRYYRLMSHALPAGVDAIIEHIEYDPNRSARIARIKDVTGQYHYILAAAGMRQGMNIKSGVESPIEVGNRLPLRNIPLGTTIHAIELQIGRGSQMVRSAGASAQLMAKEENYAQVRLPSGEVRRVAIDCTAAIGVVGNDQHQNVKLGKAGRRRRMGWRPSVRGVVMNAVDHPHGGGDGGRHGVGGSTNHGAAPRSPWGQKTLGYKTRRRKTSTKFIVKSRHEAKRR